MPKDQSLIRKCGGKETFLKFRRSARVECIRRGKMAHDGKNMTLDQRRIGQVPVVLYHVTDISVLPAVRRAFAAVIYSRVTCNVHASW